MKTFNEYQKQAQTTALYPKEEALEYVVLGLCGESGELANKVKKIIRDNNGILTEEKRKELIFELGDCLWYISALCSELNGNLGDVAEANIQKLFSRKKRGVIKGSGDNR